MHIWNQNLICDTSDDDDGTRHIRCVLLPHFGGIVTLCNKRETSASMWLKCHFILRSQLLGRFQVKIKFFVNHSAHCCGPLLVCLTGYAKSWKRSGKMWCSFTAYTVPMCEVLHKTKREPLTYLFIMHPFQWIKLKHTMKRSRSERWEGVSRVEGANEVCCRILIFFISTNSLAVSSYNRRPFSFVGFCLWRSTQFVIHDTIMSLALVDNYRKIIFIIWGCDGRTIFILCISC